MKWEGSVMIGNEMLDEGLEGGRKGNFERGKRERWDW